MSNGLDVYIKSQRAYTKKRQYSTAKPSIRSYLWAPSLTMAHCKTRTGEWTKNRKFEPTDLYGKDVKIENVEVRDDDEIWTYVACEDGNPCPHCSCIQPHLNCIVIAVDGACMGNGSPEAKAAAGVFFGKGSTFNTSTILTEPKATNQIAELTAGIIGLEKAMEIQRLRLEEEKLYQVVIKSDSQYLVNGMTNWVFKWETNGYQTSKGTPVVNSALFKQLGMLIGQLNKLGVEVLFWHVSRRYNEQADKLANMALQS
jgi:ribonuclease HI